MAHAATATIRRAGPKAGEFAVIAVTISAGVTSIREDDSADTLARADATLYRAKAAGRNQVLTG